MSEQSRLLARQFRATIAPNALASVTGTASSTPKSEPAATTTSSGKPSIAHISKQTAVWMFEYLSKSSEARQELAQVEASYALAIASLLENRDTALAHLRERYAYIAFYA